MQALKDALAAQQQQIQQLQQSLTQRDQAVQAAQQAAQQAQTAATDAEQKATAAASASADKDSVAKLNSDLTDVKTTVQNQLLTAQDEQKRVSLIEGALGRFRWAVTFEFAARISSKRESRTEIAPASAFASDLTAS